MTNAVPVPENHEHVTAETEWHTLDTAPRDRKIILFCPFTESPDGTGAHPEAKVAHKYPVGCWSDYQMHWVDDRDQKVYPSRWAEGKFD